jgi:hypothetical protein
MLLDLVNLGAYMRAPSAGEFGGQKRSISP